MSFSPFIFFNFKVLILTVAHFVFNFLICIQNNVVCLFVCPVSFIALRCVTINVLVPRASQSVSILSKTTRTIDSVETRKMFPSHLSVADFGVFAAVLAFGLIAVLLFMFDFVSILS